MQISTHNNNRYRRTAFRPPIIFLCIPMRISLLLFLLLQLTHLQAQEFNCYWICHPEADDSSQIQFQHTFRSIKRPQQASLTVASTGRFQVFVNERNVSRDVLLPSMAHSKNTAQAISFDITRFLDEQYNTIAIWYSPIEGIKTDKQISACYSGLDYNGKPFSHFADGSWNCKTTGMYTLPGNEEYIDGRRKNALWKSTDTGNLDWKNPCTSSDTTHFMYILNTSIYPSQHIVKHLEPVNISTDNLGTHVDFGRTFTGWIRITLREAKMGEEIQIGGLTYICTGEMDEQACRKFTYDTQKTVLITGDSDFKPEQIQTIEGLEIVPYIHNSYLY